MNKKFFSATALAALAFTAISARADVPVLNDGQITQIILTADQSQIDAGLAAHDQAMDAAVKDYADKSILNFTNHMVDTKKLEVKTGIQPEDSAANKSLKDETDKNLQDIKSQKGTDFDKAYIDSQVVMLQKFLDGLDQALIPQAQNADLKAFLQSSRAPLEADLNSAKALQAQLNPPPPQP